MLVLTHLVTGKQVTILDKRSVAAVMSGEEATTKVNTTWIVVDKIPFPIPVKESEEEVLARLQNATVNTPN